MSELELLFLFHCSDILLEWSFLLLENRRANYYYYNIKHHIMFFFYILETYIQLHLSCTTLELIVRVFFFL